MEKIYDPKVIEKRWIDFWDQQQLAQPPDKGTSYCIMLPPPNVTGTLHMGHAFQQTLMDALIRYHRMRGDNTNWVVVTDHAGIATQIVVERQLQAEGKTRLDLGRERFVERVSRAVVEVFVQLYQQGLIYRGKRLVNWDPVLGTAVSDLEVDSEEENGKIWEVRYPFADGLGGLVVATTRPETMLGDVAVAVNP